jgi:hypothetical protein
MKSIVVFKVEIDKNIWTWEKMFYSKDLEQSINNYLNAKEFAFWTKEDVKWKKK